MVFAGNQELKLIHAGRLCHISKWHIMWKYFVFIV